MVRYHMHRTDREINAEQELIEHLRAGIFCSIAMCRNKDPYIVTLSYGYEENKNSLYFEI